MDLVVVVIVKQLLSYIRRVCIGSIHTKCCVRSPSLRHEIISSSFVPLVFLYIMDNIVTAAQNSATDFGFSRMVYSYARQLRMERKKYPDQHTDVGGMRQVVLDIVRSVRRAARIRRFLRGIVYERGARDSATEGRQQKLKLLRSGDEEGSDYDSDDGGGRKKKKGRGGLRRGKGKKNAGGSSSRNRAGVGSDGSGHNDDDDLAGSNQLLIGGGLSEGEELGGSQPAGSGLGMSGSTHGDGVSGGGLGEKKRRKKGGGDNSQADADENSKVTQSRSKPRCFTMMDEACENVTPTSPIKSLLELHALLKLIEPRMHEFRGLSVSFWRSLNHLLRCCQDRERWGRDMDTVEEIQMYWIGVVEQFEGRVVRRGGCRHDKVPNIDSFYDKIGASDELAESDGEGLGRENVEKVIDCYFEIKCRGN